MPIQVQSTANVALTGVKILAYGAAGAGKTRLISTLPNPIILSTEAGLLSLRQYDLPYIVIATLDDLHEAYEWLLSGAGSGQYESVALDSISEIAEVVLNQEKKATKDPRQAYGAMQEMMGDLIRAFRDIPNMHVYMSAKMDKSQDEMGKMLYAPSMPGNKAGQALPYFFDEVFALRVEKDEAKAEYRVLQTNTDGKWAAKDRSDTLEMWEEPDLGAIIEKISAGSEAPQAAPPTVAAIVAKPERGKKTATKPAKKGAAPAKRAPRDAEENWGADEEDDNE